MVANNRSKFVFIFLALLAGFSSCRTSREFSTERLRPLNADKLLEQAAHNAFDYTDLTIRRINVQYSGNNAKTSFRVNLKAVKNDKILASVSKINFPVGRVLLTPNNFTYVNYIDKNYFVGDYSFLAELLNFSLSFEIIQGIISYQVVPHANHRNFVSFVENGKYVLQSAGNQNNVNTGRLKNLFAEREVQASGFGSSDSNHLIQTMYYNPRSFFLEKLVLDDSLNQWTLEVNFEDFQRVDNKEYPGTIDMKMVSPGETTELKIKMNGFSTEKIDEIELNIPESYQLIRVN